MQTIRVFFTKQDQAAYISHLDLQRAMARALRQSKLPVWYSQGFNPHIYLSFAVALPLYQESIAECVDFKTEAEDFDFDAAKKALNEVLPNGIEVKSVAPAVHESGDIVFASYRIVYTGDPENLNRAVDWYNDSGQVMALRKTKRTEAMVDLKESLPQIRKAEENAIEITLPAGNQVSYNPVLLARVWREQGFMEPADLCIVRTGVFMEDGKPFC